MARDRVDGVMEVDALGESPEARDGAVDGAEIYAGGVVGVELIPRDDLTMVDCELVECVPGEWWEVDCDVGVWRRS